MPSGIIPVYKEKGFTSFDVVAKLRGILGIKKIGHTGTLDPMATGVLPVCIGKATKLVDYLTDYNKEYEAVIRFGIETDSYDITGKIVREIAFDSTEEEIIEALSSFVGELEQIPPMFSAIKVNGQRLYELARAGQVVERKPRKCFIYSIEPLNSYSLPLYGIRVTCSKGTYIRSLAHDLGQKLNSSACLAHLQRTAVGGFKVEDCYSLAQIEAKVNELGGREAIHFMNKSLPFLISMEELFQEMPSVAVSDLGKKTVVNGGKINKCMMKSVFPEKEPETLKKEIIRIYSESGEFLALYRYSKEEKTWKLLLLNENY